MSFLANIRIRNKLLLMLIVPVSGLLYFSADLVLDKYRLTREMGELRTLTTLTIKTSALVHELQKERGMTGGFLGSGGTAYVAEMSSQKVEADKRISDLKEFLKSFDGSRFGVDFKNTLSGALSGLDTISGRREAAASLTITAGDFIKHYTGLIDSLLEVIEHVAKLSKDAEISALTSAYVYFLYAKEKTALERGTLNSVFSLNRYEPGMFLRVNAAITAGDIYTKLFLSLASREQKDFYKNKVSGRTVDEAARMRRIAVEKAAEGNFGIDPPYWWKTMTDKIGILKEVEDKLSGDLNARTGLLKKGATEALMLSAPSTAAALLIVLFLAFGITRQITSSLSSGIRAAEVISQGDLTAGMTIDGCDETCQLLASLGTMTGKLKKVIADVKSASNTLASASHELSASSEEMSRGMTEQAGRASQIAASATEMSQTVIDIAKNSSDIALSAMENAKTARNGEEIVNRSVNEVRSIADTVKESARLMASLGERSKQIGEIVGVINDIADQTNLLALNAAIEAARAGEHGMGFSVVADEVRKLAERTATATSEIGGMIKSMQDEVTTAVLSMGEGAKKVEAGVELSNEAGSALHDIVKSVDGLQSMVQQIASATEEMSTVSEQISGDIETVANVSKEISGASEQVAHSSSDLARLAADLSGTVAQFRV